MLLLSLVVGQSYQQKIIFNMAGIMQNNVISKHFCKNCKKDFETDLASVPRSIWWLISPWDIARAAIIHDLLYRRIRQYRAENETPDNPDLETVVNNYKAAKVAADKVFLMAMKDASPHVPNWKIKAAYNAVVVFGRWSIIPTEDNI